MESANQIEQQQNNEQIPVEQLMTEEMQQEEVQENVEEQQPQVEEKAQEMPTHEAEEAKNQEEESVAVEEVQENAEEQQPQVEEKAQEMPTHEAEEAKNQEEESVAVEESSAAPQSEEVAEEKRLFVCGIPSAVPRKDLVEYFTQFGEVKQVSVKTKIKDGKLNRFAYVIFADPASYDKALAIAEHKVKGLKIKVRSALPKSSTLVVCVRNIGSLSHEEIQNHFSKFGQIKNITNLPGNNYCFVSFLTEQATVEALKEAKQTIGSTEVTVGEAPSSCGMNSRGNSQRDAQRYATYGSRFVNPAFYWPAHYYGHSYDRYDLNAYMFHVPCPLNIGIFRGGLCGARRYPY